MPVKAFPPILLGLILLLSGCRSHCTQSECRSFSMPAFFDDGMETEDRDWFNLPGLFGDGCGPFGTCRHESHCRPGHYWVPGGYSSDIDEMVARSAAKQCARRALRELDDGHDFEYESDFEDGFRRAYVDVATGGSGTVPPVPPEKYWKASYRSAEGHAQADAWFAGYRAGAQSARSDGLDAYNTIPASAASYAVDDCKHGPEVPIHDTWSTPHGGVPVEQTAPGPAGATPPFRGTGDRFLPSSPYAPPNGRTRREGFPDRQEPRRHSPQPRLRVPSAPAPDSPPSP